MRQEDFLARLGGDEFVILLEDVVSREGAVRVAETTLRQIESITSAGGHPVKISASIGISCAQGRFGVTYSGTALLDEADHAMYKAKQNGKGRIAFADDAPWPVRAVPAEQTAMSPPLPVSPPFPARQHKVALPQRKWSNYTIKKIFFI